MSLYPETFTNQTLPAVIASGQTVSAAVDLPINTVCGFYTPASLTGTSFTFQASQDGVTFYPVYGTDGTLLNRPVGASRYVALPPIELAGVRQLKIVSNSAEAADRTILLAFRAVY